MIYRTTYRWCFTVVCAWVALFVGCQRQAIGEVNAVSAHAAKQLIEQHQEDPHFVILDIRTPGEYQQSHIGGAILVDYYNPQFKQLLGRLDRTKTYLVYCRSGNRSGRALKIFSELGFSKIYHLDRGIIAWKAKQLPLVSNS